MSKVLDIEQFKNADIMTIATAMASPDYTNEDKYKLSKLMLEVTKQVYIDPMKELREKEKAEEQTKAEQRAALISEYRDRLNGLFGEEFLDSFGEIAADYIEAGHGLVVSVEVFAKKDETTGEVKAEFSSNIAKARARKATSTRTRDSGKSGAGVWVSGSPKEGTAGPSIPKKEFKSFAEAARELGFVDDSTEMKGLNCKRLLENKGYSCGYQEEAANIQPVATIRSRF